uniref:Acetyl-CoA hydrolase n=1 Tax=Plectus sambesii TaxID=2011161 RepID=A0A914WYA2_9BILA
MSSLARVFLTRNSRRLSRSVHVSASLKATEEAKEIGELSSHECSYPIAGKQVVRISAQQAVEHIKSGDKIFVHGIAATPTPLLNALCEHAKKKDLKHITLHHLHLEGPAPWATEEYKGIIRSNSLFTGANLRAGVNNGTVDFNSVFLSEIPLLFKRNVINLNVALIHVSAPDSKGFCSLGTSVDATRSAIINADYIIAMVNQNMPRTFGDGLIHSSHIDGMVFCDFPLHERPNSKLGDQELKIGMTIAEHLVEDGATLQMGIGAIPDAALVALKNHKDLGIHTEMFSDGVLDLVERNVITNAHKKIHPGKIVSSFVYGSKRLYEFLHDNPMIFMGDVSWVNDTSMIRQNPKVAAINSAVEIDLTGQVVADSVGSRFLSGFGGQIDFIRGASLCNDGRGKPIIALPSQTKKGESKIVPFIKEGAGVVTTRAHVHYVVTEFGIAQLFGRNMRQRAFELIRIAHPDHQERLEEAAFSRLKVMPSPD